MGSITRTFDIKTSLPLLQVIKLALQHTVLPAGMPTLRQIKNIGGVSGRISLNFDEASLLQTALTHYAAQELREGSDPHKVAIEFSAALGDFIATGLAKAAPAVEEAVNPEYDSKTVGGAIPTVADKLERRLKAKRDAIFRHIVGRPADLSIWGLPKVKKEPEVPKAKGRVPANLQQNRVKTLDGVLGDSDGPRERLASVADEECDVQLTQGRVPAYNEQMKREGAHELLNVTRNQGANEQGTVVGDTGEFEHKLRVAQQAGDSATEIQMLSALWVSAPDPSL